jgi:hypothetical protein
MVVYLSIVVVVVVIPKPAGAAVFNRTRWVLRKYPRMSSLVDVVRMASGSTTVPPCV